MNRSFAPSYMPDLAEVQYQDFGREAQQVDARSHHDNNFAR